MKLSEALRKLLALLLVLVTGTAVPPAFAADAVSSATVNIASLPELAVNPDASVLVIFFSTNDTVKAVSYTIADILRADVFEIVPETPYTEDDLRYYTDCRADREQKDSTARPAISVWPDSMEAYDTVFIGYPIWHGQAPRILYTLLEGIDLSGKTVVPFCTSASSGAGSSARNLQALAGDGAVWLDVKRIDNGSGTDDIRDWVLGLGLKEEAEMRMTINDTPVSVAWEDNDSVKALRELAAGGLTVQMSMYGGFEQVGPIGQSLPSSDVQTVTSPGDIVLYSSDRLVVFYGNNSWAYTRLGRITDKTPEEMEALLGNGNVTITIDTERTDEPRSFLRIPAETQRIESMAFAGVSADAVILPETVTDIAADAFAGSRVRFICGCADTYAERYADANGFIFIPGD